MKKKEWKTAGELLAELESDPELLERRRQHDEALALMEADLARAEIPILADLRAAGVLIGKIWDLIGSTGWEDRGIQVVLDHLQRPYPDAVREGLARALGSPAAKPLWSTVVGLYQHEKRDRVKSGLAAALAEIADDDTVDSVVDLVRDAANGSSRLLLLSALESSTLPRVRMALLELRDDPVLRKEVRAVLRRSKKREK